MLLPAAGASNTGSAGRSGASRRLSGQGALLISQDVLLSTIEHVAMLMPFGPLMQIDSPTPKSCPLYLHVQDTVCACEADAQSGTDRTATARSVVQRNPRVWGNVGSRVSELRDPAAFEATGTMCPQDAGADGERLGVIP